MPRIASALGRAFFVWFALATAAAGQHPGDLVDYTVALAPAHRDGAGKTASTVFRSDRVDAPFTGVVVQGTAGGDSLDAEIRFGDGDAWGPWHALYVVRSATDATFMAAYRGGGVRTGERFELRFTGVEPAEALRIFGAGVFDGRRDASSTAAPPADAEFRHAPAGGLDALVAVPELHRRSAWNAEPYRGTPRPLSTGSYRYLTVHHAAGFSASTLAEGREQVRRIQDFHQNGRGWDDIGYQFVLDRSGNLYQGRPFLDERLDLADAPALVLGAHVGGFNTGNIGVCLLGCYHPPEGPSCRQEIPPAALDSLIGVLAFLSVSYDVPPALIRGHRDFSATACPGDNNYRLLDEIRTRVESLIETGVAAPEAITLNPVFPNPVAASATIRYFLRQEGHVRLTVYDALGRERARPADAFQGGDRWYTVAFDAADLASGTYFYRLQVEGFAGVIFDEVRALTVVR